MRRRIGFRRRVIRPRMRRSMFWWPRLLLYGGFMFFLFGSNPYKLYRDDVTIIEQSTGKQAKDLSEEELVEAMKRLGIRRLEIDPNDREIIERG